MPMIINGEKVDEAVLDQEFSNVKSWHGQQGNVSCCERDEEFRGFARENVITRVLLVQEARRTTEAVSGEEVEKTLRRLQEEAGGIEKFFEAYNLTPDQEPQVRRDLEANLHVQKLLDGVCGPDPEPAAEEIRGFYEKHLDRWMNPERVRASHILRNPQRGEDRIKVVELLGAVREKLLAGADFNELAREHSDRVKEMEGQPPDPARGDGIDVGLFARGEIMPEFEVVAFSLRVGEISPVFLSPFGYHVVKLTERQPATPKPLEEVGEAVGRQYLEERRSGLVRSYIDGLRSKATIETPPAP